MEEGNKGTEKQKEGKVKGMKRKGEGKQMFGKASVMKSKLNERQR